MNMYTMQKELDAQILWKTSQKDLLSFSPTYALIYIIKILSQAVILIAHITPTCFDPYGSSSGSISGPCKVTD